MKGIIVCILFSLHASGQQPLKHDIVISEILFNPEKNGYDFVEGYNRSRRPVALNLLSIANRNATSDITSRKPLSRDTLLIAAGVWFIVTENEKWVRQHYNIPASALVVEISSMPSLPDEEGCILFVDQDDSIIDEVRYFADWHFPLINDPSGVSLERLDYERDGQDSNNWMSASSGSGYATPGQQNSWHPPQMQGVEQVTISPAVFSPDNDGWNDYVVVRFTLNDPSYAANTIVYDLSGRKVRYLLKNETPAYEARYKWDGLNDRSQPLPVGIYIIVTQLYNLQGYTKRFRTAVTLARR